MCSYSDCTCCKKRSEEDEGEICGHRVPKRRAKGTSQNMDKPMYLDPSNPAWSPQDHERYSPLGLFEKFKLESPLDTLSDPDSDVQFVSVLKPPNVMRQTEPSVDHHISQNLNTPALNNASVNERMHCMMDIVSPIKKKREDQSCRLLGSWNADSKEVQILDELEICSDQIDLEDYILIQDGDVDGDIIREENGELSEGQITTLLDTRRARDHLYPLAGPANLKGNLRNKTSINKRVKTLDSLKLASGKSSKDIRTTTVQTLYDVLLKRVQETQNLDVHMESVEKLAKNVENEMYNLYHDTGVRYKSKYRSLLFNLKDPKNKIFFHRVVLGEITPQFLVQLSPTEMAGQELTDWRKQERRHTLEIIERAENEPHHKRQMTKLTHKGLIEIDSPERMWTLEDLSDSPYYTQDYGSSRAKGRIDTTSQHKSHLLDVDCLICTGETQPSDDMDLSQCTKLKSPVKATAENSSMGNLSSQTLETTEYTKRDVLGAESQEMPPSSSAVWKGFIHMFSIKQFKVTAFKVSGYNTHLCQELPKTITSKGFIRPDSVWEFMDLIWPECTKDMCLLRFYPQTASDAVFCSRLYSYLNCKLKYGIIRTNKMEAFLIPLPAFQPIPPRLHPLGGPGIDDGHPHLLLGLLLPNHPSWTSCPKRISRVQSEDLDVPDDIFASILDDVEREERQMAEQGLPPIWLPSREQSSEAEDVGVPELISSLCFLANSLQEMASQNYNNYNNLPTANHPDVTTATSPIWPIHNMIPSFQPPVSYDTNAAAMVDPSVMYGPPKFWPFTF
ncbi:SPOC domain-containing protein 1 isoform X2 [Mixophyes fleayi]|uniref:SPOC domain-containing protein 1 isoform X2 n=1 Tax=Mixophyes fleayi TaxID=3061075 RepID=UPI003F4DFA85